MLTINKLDISYGDKHLFKEVSARINPNERIGLVGVNGAGKSTLLKIIANQIETDSGVVTRPRNFSVAYLPQEASGLTSERTIYQEAETAFAEALVMQQDLELVNRELAAIPPESPEFSQLLKRQGQLQHRLEGIDIYRVQSRIEKVLKGLGFAESDFDRPSRTLSGGWLMRLMLAKLLLARPDLLLLDEPTNHLDLDSLTWLENFLVTCDSGLVIISHDRIFLDKTTEITWELSLGRLTAYKGNYSKYVADKEVRLQVERAAYENQQARIKQTMRFVQRFRAKSTKARQVQSRVKQLAKMERIELAESEQEVSFRFPLAADCGRQVLTVEGLAKSFADQRVFVDLGFEMQRGDKLAVVGVNGAGKSTLMKILAGLLEPDQGTVRLGHNVTLSYFGQHQAQELPHDYTALETVWGMAETMPMTRVRSLLGAFLFQGDEVDKKVRVLSGGEKSRLALARMIVTPANLLVLDEPTNHLDMKSQEVLQEAMRQYNGSIIVVSHNRYFVNSFVNKVLEIKDGRSSLYEGNIDDYLARLEQERLSAGTGPQAKSPVTALRVSAGESGPDRTRGRAVRQTQARLRQEKSKKIAPFRNQAQTAETEIEKLEARKKELERQLADPELYQDQEAFSGYSREYKKIEERLDRQYYKWETAQAEVERIEGCYAELLGN
ncbi:MAG: ABC-F family ATP-binding cassette domain-containing protein [Desulfobacterales bacterium]|nr:ABC-F family ATP-binding cassette domain-containing protein [Desulfobacterales bacterium]